MATQVEISEACNRLLTELEALERVREARARILASRDQAAARLSKADQDIADQTQRVIAAKAALKVLLTSDAV